MSRSEWRKAIRKLKPGMSYRAAAKSIGTSYQSARKWLRVFKYKAKDGRGNGAARRKELLREFSGVDWRKSNIGLALELGRSREWIRQVRVILDKPFVEARGRKKNGI